MTGEILPPDPERARRDASGAGGTGDPGIGTPGSGGPGIGIPGSGGHGSGGPEVGRFRTDDALTGAALARYLVGRVLVERISVSLYVLGAVILVLAGVCWAFGPHWLAVLIALVALGVFGMRALVIAVLRRLLAFGRFGPAEDRIRGLVKDSQGDFRRELKRIGLPSSVFTMPLLVFRLLGRRRRETVERMSGFDVARVVPPHRQDEFSLVVREVLDRPSRPTA